MNWLQTLQNAVQTKKLAMRLSVIVLFLLMVNKNTYGSDPATLLYGVVNELVGNSSVAAQAQLNFSSAQSFNNSMSQMFQNMRAQRFTLQTIVDDATVETTSAAGGEPVTYEEVDQFVDTEKSHKTGVFFSYYGSVGLDGYNHVFTPGFDFSNIGVLVGMDITRTDDSAFGVLFNYSYNHSTIYKDLDDASRKGYVGRKTRVGDNWSLGEIDDNVLRFGVYLQKNFGNFYYNNTGTFGVHIINGKRNIHILNQQSTSERSAIDFDFYNELGYTFDFDNFLITPNYSLEFTAVNNQKFTEKGSAVSTIIDAYSAYSLAQNIGVKFGALFGIKEHAHILAEFFVNWEHEYLSLNDVTGRLVIDPNDPATLPIRRIAPDRASFGANITAKINDNFDIFGRLNAKVWDSGACIGIALGVGLKF